MKSLHYLRRIKEKYLLDVSDLAFIIESLSFIARDNDMDDSFLMELLEEIES